MEESLFSAADANQSSQALSDYLNSLGMIENPGKYRKETEERNDFNTKLLTGTGAVAGPLALTGIEGLREDAIRPGLRKLASKAGVSNDTADALAEGRADIRGAVRGAVRNGLERAGDAAAGVREQLERRALIGGNPRWPTEVNLREQGDALHRGFLDPDDPRVGRFDPEGRVQVLDDAAERPTVAEGRATLARVRSKYLARAAAREAAAPGDAALGDVADDLEPLRTKAMFRMADPEFLGFGSAREMATSVAAKAQKVGRIVNGQPLDHVPDDALPDRPPLPVRPGGGDTTEARAALQETNTSLAKLDSAEAGFRDLQAQGAGDMSTELGVVGDRRAALQSLARSHQAYIDEIQNWQPELQDEKDQAFHDGVDDARAGKFDAARAAGEPPEFENSYANGHATMNDYQNLQQLEDRALANGGEAGGGAGQPGIGRGDARVQPEPGDGPVNGGGQGLDGAAEGEAGAVRLPPKAGGGAAEDGADVGEDLGKAAATAAETDAEFGGPEDIAGDVVALGAGLATLFGGQAFEQKAPAPVLRTPLNPAVEFGLG